MKYKIISLIIATLSFGALFAQPAMAAVDPGEPLSQCTNTENCARKTSFEWCGKDTNVTIRCMVVEILKFMSFVVGIAVVGGIAWGGATYAMSQGNPAGTQKGIMIITNSIIGLVLFLLMFAIMQFLVPNGVFN